MALDEKNRNMYITDLTGGVYRTHLDNANETTLFSDLGALTGIAIVCFD
jgi:hypothetical protein